jgi:hypothetical protein
MERFPTLFAGLYGPDGLMGLETFRSQCGPPCRSGFVSRRATLAAGRTTHACRFHALIFGRRSFILVENGKGLLSEHEKETE